MSGSIWEQEVNILDMNQYVVQNPYGNEEDIWIMNERKDVNKCGTTWREKYRDEVM